MMILYRTLLIVIFSAVFGYTVVVVANHGMGLLPVFSGDMATMGWPGQFNPDFMCFSALSAIWLSWRHLFTPVGIMVGMVGFFGGVLFLSTYLLIESFRACPISSSSNENV